MPKAPARPYPSRPGAAITVQGAELGEGARLGWRFVPQAVRKSWLRLKLSPAGSGSHDGHIFAALLREEDFPYEKELRVR